MFLLKYFIFTLLLFGQLVFPIQTFADEYLYDGYKKLYASKDDDSFMFIQPPVMMRVCEVDSDCVSVAESCGASSSCGSIPINKKYVEEFYLNRDLLCKDSKEEFPLSRCKQFKTIRECIQGICNVRSYTEEDYKKDKMRRKELNNQKKER